MSIRGWWCWASAALFLAGPALAEGRKEFPRTSRLSLQLTEAVGDGGQFLPPTARKPRVKEEPKYRSSQPLYVTVRLGARRDPFTLVLDSSRGADRRYDLLYVDADGDGRITAGDKVTGSPQKDGALFGPVQLPIDCGGAKCPQWFVFRLTEQELEGGPVFRSFQVLNAGSYQGLVAFGDQKRLVALVDADSDGLYNGYLKAANETGDRLLLDLNGDGQLDGGHQSEEAQPLGRYVQVGDRYWRLEVAPDGSSVSVEPLAQPLGTLRAGAADFTLLLNGDEGVLRVRSTAGTARVPAGKYRLGQCTYRLTEKTGESWQFAAQVRGGGPVVEVPAGGQAAIRFGPPLVPRVTVTPAGRGELRLSLELRGAGGEVYHGVHRGNAERPPVPRARIVDANNRELAVLDFHYG
jgi:hypothetical protein